MEDGLGNVLCWNGEVYTIEDKEAAPLRHDDSDTDVIMRRLGPAGQAQDEGTVTHLVRYGL